MLSDIFLYLELTISDLVEDEDTVPCYRSQIIAKVLRVDWESVYNHNEAVAENTLREHDFCQQKIMARSSDMLLLDHPNVDSLKKYPQEVNPFGMVYIALHCFAVWHSFYRK